MRKLAIGLVGAALVLCAAVYAQSVAGRIVGSVYDKSSSAIPGATVAALNAETGARVTASSNGEGRYVLYPLPPGVYDLSVQAKGFQEAKLAGVRVDVAATLSRNLTLDVARVESAVTVEADAAPVLSQTSSLESTIVREQIDTLPLNGRDFNQLVLLAAGAVDNNVGGGTDFGAVAVNGNRAYSNDYLLDGTPNNNLFQNRSAAPVSVDLIREFKVTSGVAATSTRTPASFAS